MSVHQKKQEKGLLCSNNRGNTHKNFTNEFSHTWFSSQLCIWWLGDKEKTGQKYITISNSWQWLFFFVCVLFQSNSTNIYDSGSVLCDSNTEMINI